MDKSTPWALNLQDSNRILEDDSDNKAEYLEVDTRFEENHDSEHFENDIYLSDLRNTNNTISKYGELTSHNAQSEPTDMRAKSNEQIMVKRVFHPDSQVKLYNKGTYKAALIRLGHCDHNLVTVVIDMCFQHYGNASDWRNKESVAFSIEELIMFYGAFKTKRKVKMTLKFHAMTSNPVSIEVSNSELKIESGPLILVGNLAKKAKFIAMCETALRIYVEQAFPDCDFSDFLGFMAMHSE